APTLQRPLAGTVAPTVSAERTAESTRAPRIPSPPGGPAARTAPPGEDRPSPRLRAALLGLVGATLLIGAGVAIVLTGALSTGKDKSAADRESLDKRRFAAKVTLVCSDLAPRAEA